MQPEQFKAAMASWASGVAVVTANQDGMLYGLTVSSFTSVSLDPPLVLACLGHDNRMSAMIAAATRFAVSLLGEDQEPASSYFAIPGREPTEGFVRIDGEWTELGVPVVKGALAWVVCDHHSSADAGDHVVVIGRVVAAAVADDGRGPLLYWRRKYRKLAP
jgi:flavin reductase (DIM6/NTAB) family NADH-FMN oxidoreductase RutF